MARGYVKIWRSMLENPVLRGDTAVSITFLFYIQAAAYKAKPWDVAGTVIHLERGQWFGPIASVEEVTGLTRKQVRRAESVLAQAGMIRVEPVANRGRLVTVMNYDEYQGTREVRADRGPTEGTTTGPTEGTTAGPTAGPTNDVEKNQEPQGNLGFNSPGGADRGADRRADRGPTAGPTEGTPLKKKEEGRRRNKQTKQAPCPGRTDPDRPPYDYLGDWNAIAEQRGWTQLRALTSRRRAKLKARESEAAWDWPAILAELEKVDAGWTDGFAGWSFDWLISNDTNHVKVAEGKYRRKGGDRIGREGAAFSEEEDPW